MVLRPVILLLIFFFPGVSLAQAGGPPEKAALRDMENHRWEKAEARLRKSLSRDALNPSVRYALSVYYLHRDNPAYHLDSAYHYAVTAFSDYKSVSARTRDRLARVALDSPSLATLRMRIETVAFEAARSENTEPAYLFFLSHFPFAGQKQFAEELRDEVAFQRALIENTPEAFQAYFKNYPQSKRALDAQIRYDRLLFEQETSDHRLSSYERFLSDHPETSYKEEIYRNIFEISTAAGTVESFGSFVSRYPSNKFVERARQIIFYLLAEDERPDWPHDFLTDSLRHMLRLNKAALIPFLRDERFGFMDDRGADVIPPTYHQIHEDYLCGNVDDDVLIVDNRLITRDGTTICRGPVSALSDLGGGFLKVIRDGRTTVMHKSGFIVKDSVDDARLVNKRFLAVRSDDVWWLYSLTGRLLDARPWHDISAVHDLLLLSRNEKKFIARIAEGPNFEATALKLSDAFDEVKPWPNGLIWGRSGNFEGVLNDRLESVIGFDHHALGRTFFGASATLPSGFALYNHAGRKSSMFEDVKILGKRVAVKKNGLWSFFDPSSHTVIGRTYDSLTSEGPFFLVATRDSITVHFQNSSSRRFHKPKGFSFVPGKDSTSFLVADLKGRDKTVYDLNGKKLFAAFFDGIEYAGDGIFVVSRKQRKGVINTNGEQLLSPEFDAVGSVKDGVVSVLKNRKFGTLHIEKGKFIKPLYDRNPLPYTHEVVTVFKDGFYGFIGWDDKPLSTFDFDEIAYWSDSLALVRQGPTWSLYDIVRRTMIEHGLRNVSVVRDSPKERVAIVQKGSEFGVISSTGKTIIPITFSDVINLGSAASPLYFTEKHVPEASLHVVIYYDATGNMLRKEIYDDAREFDRIYCSDQ